MYSTLADAIIKGTRENVEQLLSDGADINEIDIYGYTPLIEAAIAEKTSIAKLLVSQGADVNLQDVTGRSPLYWAVETHNIPLCQFLLEHNADPNSYTLASEPALVMPLLRGQSDLKQMLYQYGAKLQFAQDYINTKLTAHRFELQSKGHILNHDNEYIGIDYEGFVLEFSIEVICHSLSEYLHHFAARHLRHFFETASVVVQCLQRATQALKFQHFTVDIADHAAKINTLIDHDPIIIPVAYEGHAVTFVRCGPYFAKCDRGEASKRFGTVSIYKITNSRNFNHALIKFLMYKKQKKHFIEVGINELLGLTKIDELPIPAQITGNCSWANVEAAIPALIFMLWYHNTDDLNAERTSTFRDAATYFYQKWLEWDQDRAISNCINEFNRTDSKPRKASIVELLAAVLFQHGHYDNQRDVRRAEKILPLLTDPDYEFALRNYIELFYYQKRTPEGENLMNLLDIAGFHLD